MSQRPTLCLLGLLLALSAPPAMAQQLSDSERAKRDAAKVFNFIKFHAVRAKSAPVATAAPVAAVAAAPAAARPRAEPAAEPAARPIPETSAIRTTVEPVAAAAVPVAALADSQPGTTLPPVSEPAMPAQPAVVAPAAQPEPEPEPVEIKLIHHVQPELPRGNSLRDGTVRVRFTVEPDGRVSKAAAADGAQRRLANSATRAIEQWRFAPIPEAQEIEVDIDFRFD
jgi:TonB family protein